MKQRFSSVPKMRLCFLSYRHLSRLVMEVAEEFAARADIDIIDEAFEPALEHARARERLGVVDAFVSAGSNAMILRGSVVTPVATIKVSGYDILVALRKARQLSRRVGIVTYGSPIAELDAVKGLLDIEIVQYAYRTRDEARTCFQALVADQCTVIIGSSLAVELAEQYGLHGILAYSLASVREGINDAIELAKVSRLEAARYDQLQGVLQNLQEAVLAVDTLGHIIALNSPMESLIGRSRHSVIGHSLDDIAPEMSVAHTLATGQEERQKVCQIGQREWLMNRTLMRERDSVTGAIITLYDTNLIHEADSTLRSQRKGRQLPRARWTFNDLVGYSSEFVRARESAIRLADAEATVLISGESGTGKELFAQAIHNASVRADKPFIAVNCAAVPENLLESELFGYEEGAFTGARKGGKQGLVEAAHTGTLFLDEIGDMPITLQTRLLRVLQEREVIRVGGIAPIPVDVRILAATHQPLNELIAQKRFRADLYYRLNILRLALPPLRDRGHDIDILARAILQRSLQRLGSALDSHAVLAPLYARLRSYSWPGNVRELENFCERIAVCFAKAPDPAAITDAELRIDCPELYAEPLALEEAETHLQLADVLKACRGNRNDAARRLGISRSTLWRRMRAAGLAHDQPDDVATPSP